MCKDISNTSNSKEEYILRAQQEVEECNAECMKCRKDYERAGIEFSVHVCSMCPIGAKLHQELLKISDGERKFGAIDWNSSQYKKYYGH